MYLRTNSSFDPIMLNAPAFIDRQIQFFTFAFQPEEVFLPHRKPAGLFNLHSPFVFEQPFQNGITLTPGHTYMISMRLEEEDLLPYPYHSDCVNYTEIWESRGQTGPRSKDACKHLCGLEHSLDICNCTFPEVLYPNEGPFCDFIPYFDEENCLTSERNQERQKEALACMEKCKEDCSKLKFHHDYQVRTIEHYSESGVPNQGVVVRVLSADPEVVKLKYRPQYQDLEVFSYLGGFIAAWIGVSLVAIIDLIESLTSITSFFFRKRKLTKAEDAQPSKNDGVSSA